MVQELQSFLHDINNKSSAEENGWFINTVMLVAGIKISVVSEHEHGREQVNLVWEESKRRNEDGAV